MKRLWFRKKHKRALVLSGGSARGLAHLGVTKVLRREGLKFDLVVGTSIGALVGATYCLEMPYEGLEKIAISTTTNSIVDITISRMGLADGARLENIIRRSIGHQTFADLKTPLAVTAVDIETGEELYFTDGDLALAIKASCALPGIYKPVELNGRLLIDGGMRQHLPIDIAVKLGADIIVAVDVGFSIKKGKITNMLGVIIQSIQILGEELSMHQSKKADILIKPALGGDVDQMAFNRAAFIINKGEEAAMEMLPLLKKCLC